MMCDLPTSENDTLQGRVVELYCRCSYLLLNFALGILTLFIFAPQFHAMDTMHNNGYDMTRAIAALVPQGGPVLCRDEMEEWSASEANLFEEALEKYGKDFTDIQQDFVSLQ